MCGIAWDRVGLRGINQKFAGKYYIPRMNIKRLDRLDLEKLKKCKNMIGFDNAGLSGIEWGLAGFLGIVEVY